MNRTIDPQRLRRLHIFRTIVAAGSLTDAARQLGLSKSVVSSHLRGLEDDLGVRLLERTTRHMALTQVGEAVLAAAIRMCDAAEDAVETAFLGAGAVRGLLRVAAPLELGMRVVRPIVARFRTLYPQLRFDLRLSDGPVDLLAESLDVALRIGVPRDSGHVLRTLARDEERIFASPGLLHTWPDITHPDHLASAPWLVHQAVARQVDHFTGPSATTSLRIDRPVVVTQHTDMLRDLAIDGAGFVVLPSHMARRSIQDGLLIDVLPTWRRNSLHIYALLPSRLSTPRARVFLDAVQAEMNTPPRR